jgi:iduronate 2-sulfatase
VISNPESPWRAGAFSQYFKGKPGVGRVLGTSVRTNRYRYTEWRKGDYKGKLEDITLIDFEGNPDKNIAADPAHADLIKKLSKLAKESGSGLKP